MIAEMLASSPWFWIVTLSVLVAVIHRRKKVMGVLNRTFKLPLISSATRKWENGNPNSQQQLHELPD